MRRKTRKKKSSPKCGSPKYGAPRCGTQYKRHSSYYKLHPTSHHNPSKINMDDREKAITAAVDGYHNGTYASIRAAAKAHKISDTTLRRRLAGIGPHRTAHAKNQRLSAKQEDFLVEWILEEAERHSPPSHARARDMASRMMRMNDDDKKLGHNWLWKFCQRHPSVKAVIGRKPEQVQADPTTEERGVK
jgi:hypothetical protein